MLHCLQRCFPRMLDRSFEEGLLGQRILEIGSIFYSSFGRKIKQNFPAIFSSSIINIPHTLNSAPPTPIRHSHTTQVARSHWWALVQDFRYKCVPRTTINAEWPGSWFSVWEIAGRVRYKGKSKQTALWVPSFIHCLFIMSFEQNLLNKIIWIH